MADTVVESAAIAENTDNEKTEEVKSESKKRSRSKTPKTKTTPKAKAGSPNKKQKKTVSDLHPKYSQMINEAIASLKDRHGSSRQAILKYIVANYNVLQDEKLVNNHVKMSIRAGIKSGKLKQIKGSGACGSYKLGDKVAEKQPKPKASKSASPAKKVSLTKVKKPKAAKKAKSPAKKSPAGKASPKTSPKKTKASPKKSPKKAKSPKKTKAKKVSKSPKKSKKATAPEVKDDAADAEASAEETAASESDQ